MAKPAAPSEWASGAAPADVVEPAAGKQASGWTTEMPPHSYFNWFWQLVTLWIIWLDSVLLDGAVAGRLGAQGIDSTAADVDGAGVTAEGNGTGPGVSAVQPAGVTGHAVYAVANGGGNGVWAESGDATAAPLHLQGQAAVPTAPVAGDICVDTSSGTPQLKFYDGTGWKTVQTV